MAWTSITNARIDADSPLDTDLFTDYRDNLIELRESVFALYFTEQSTNAGSWTTLHTFSLYIPTITQETGRSRGLGVRVDYKVDASTTGELRVNEATAGASNLLTGLTATSYTVTSEMLLQDSTFDAGGVFTFTIDGQISAGAGSVYIKSVDLVSNRVIW